ncbi:MAG: flagellar type III secretion system protein FliR [Candidatus Omnitrophica bacterium]|nr:flagellar type III secretion system protein FliR [Candidatus Omnitrophota bacterium]
MNIFRELFQFGYQDFQGFLLVSVRFSGLVLSAPLISNPNIPKTAKIGFILFISFLVFPFIASGGVMIQNNLVLTAMALRELIIGFFLGFFVSLIFAGIQLAGQFIDYQSGFGLVNVIDPQSNVQVPLAGQFMYILASLLFLILGGHHMLLRGLVGTFDVFPLGTLAFDLNISHAVQTLFARMVVVAFQISAPVVGAIFVAEMTYGVVARAIPQINILIVGLPLKIGIGTLFLLLSLPFFFWVIKREFMNVFESLQQLGIGV